METKPMNNSTQEKYLCNRNLKQNKEKNVLQRKNNYCLVSDVEYIKKTTINILNKKATL